MVIPICSERLMFRIINKNDVSDKYIGWLNDPDVNRYLETRFSPQTRESCECFVEMTDADPDSYLFGMFDKTTSAHIGNIKLGFIKKNHKSAQLSLFIGQKNYWGKGYATESIRRVTQWGFDFIGLKRIEAGCYDSNLGSLRAFLKVGYTVEGFQRNSVESNGQRIGCFNLAILDSDCLKPLHCSQPLVSQ